MERMSGVNQNTIRAIENRGISKPEYETIFKLAQAFGRDGEVLFETAGYPKPLPKPSVEMSIQELVQEISRRYEADELEHPQKIPVYDELPAHAGAEHAEPSTFVYPIEPMKAGENIAAYRIRGQCLSPKVENGDIVIVDKNISPITGRLVVCMLTSGDVVVGKYELVHDAPWLHNNEEALELKDCQYCWVIIWIYKRP